MDASEVAKLPMQELLKMKADPNVPGKKIPDFYRLERLWRLGDVPPAQRSSVIRFVYVNGEGGVGKELSNTLLLFLRRKCAF